MTFRPHPKQAEFMREPAKRIMMYRGFPVSGLRPSPYAGQVLTFREFWQREAFRAGWQAYGRRLGYGKARR